MPSEHAGRERAATATTRPDSVPPALGPSYLVLLLKVLGEAGLQTHREFLELQDGVGIGGIVFEAHGVLHDFLHQEKCLLNVTNGVFLKKENLELTVWLMRPGNPGSLPNGHHPRPTEGCSRPSHYLGQRPRAIVLWYLGGCCPQLAFHSLSLGPGTAGDWGRGRKCGFCLERASGFWTMRL